MSKIITVQHPEPEFWWKIKGDQASLIDTHRQMNAWHPVEYKIEGGALYFGFRQFDGSSEFPEWVHERNVQPVG